MSGIKFYTVDVESTGLSSKYHEVFEISIIRVDDRVQLTETIKCDYPDHANFDSLAITKKTLKDLENGSSKEYVVNKINQFLNNDNLTPAHRCFIAHNASFDMRMIQALYEKVGQTVPVEMWACSMALSRAYAKKIGMIKPKVNLAAACDLLEIKRLAGAHASKVDARNTYLLWKKLTEDKQMDYLPFIKQAKHILLSSNEEQGLDPDLLDIE